MQKKVSMLRNLKYRISIISILSLIMIVSLLGVLFYGNKLNYDNQKVIEELGKQLGYTQVMANYTLQLYAMQDMKSEKTDDVLNQEINNTRKKLKQTIDSYEAVLQGAIKGSMMIEDKNVFFRTSKSELQNTIQDMKRLWNPFKAAVITVLDENNGDEKVLEALTFIDMNYQRLYSYGNKLTQLVVEDSRKSDMYRMAISAVLFILALSVAIAQLLYIVKCILLPLDDIYAEMKNLGITKKTLSVTPKTSNKFILPIIQEVNDKLLKLSWLISMIQNINNNDNFSDVLQYMYTSFSKFIPLNHVGIALIEEDRTTIKAAYCISDTSMTELSEKLMGYKESISQTSLGSVIDSGTPRKINDLEEYTKNKPQKEYNRILIESGIRSSITVPLKINNKFFGVIFFSSRQKDAYSEEHTLFLETLADSIAISFNKSIFINEILYGSSLALAKLAESRDHYTGEHLNRMKCYSSMIVRNLSVYSKYKDKIDYQFIQDIEKFSELHDIGKVAIEDSILLKPGKLTADEFKIMKMHTIYGAKVLREADASIQKGKRGIFQTGIEIAECHHEKWNGCGYPHGLKGEDIPLSARIVAVADVFDALTSSRPYKEAFTFEKAYNIILQGKGEDFDPEIVDIFIQDKRELRKTYDFFYNTSEAIVL